MGMDWSDVVMGGRGSGRTRGSMGSPDGSEDSVESQRKKWFGGIVGAGVAGVILVTGLTFAAFSFSKQNHFRPKRQMEPLTTEQELSLVSDDQNDSAKDDGNEGENALQEDSSLEGRTGTYKDSSSSPEFDETHSESRVGDDSDGWASSVQDVKNTSDGTDAINDASIQEDLLHESAFDDKSIAPNTISESLNLLEYESVSDSFVASGFKDVDSNLTLGMAESAFERIHNPDNAELLNLLVSDANPSELNSDPQDELPGSPELPVALNVSVNSQSDATLETHNSPQDDIETVAPPSTKENLE